MAAWRLRGHTYRMDWVAFDLETTGLPRWSRPVEIGARRFGADGAVRDFTTLVNPGLPIPAEVIRIHGITDEVVADAPDVATALHLFLRFVDGAALVAHNAGFDAGIFAYNAARARVELPDVPVHDSVRLARRLLPHVWSYRLGNLTRTLGIQSETYHRALPDAILVGRLMQRLLGLHAQALVGFPAISDGLLGRLPEFAPRPPVPVPGQKGREAPRLSASP